MTAQLPEHLIHQGQTLTLATEPLDLFMVMAALPWKLNAHSTALWRGYIGTWAIEADRLYLKSLKGWVKELEKTKEVGLEDLFPGFPDGVFAHWYTGELRCPHGALLKYVHGGFHSVYEEDHFLRVQRGVLKDERIVRNGTAPPNAEAGYLIKAWTTFGIEE